jgi:hypothetical protein
MTESNHSDDKPENKKWNPHKSTTYADDCTEGCLHIPPNMKDGRPRVEVHHIVCEDAIKNRKSSWDEIPLDAATQNYIEACLKVTPWDINRPTNLVRLPRNRRFRVDWAGAEYEVKKRQKAVKATLSDKQGSSEVLMECRPQWTPVDWPSHQVDHTTADGYTTEVATYLKENIWNVARKNKKDGKPHKTTAEELLEAFSAAENYFRGELFRRGALNPGKVDGFMHRHDKAYNLQVVRKSRLKLAAAERSGRDRRRIRALLAVSIPRGRFRCAQRAW